MSNSLLERVERWGEVLAELSEVLDKLQSEVIKEEALEIPKVFEGLEILSSSVTPNQVKEEIDAQMKFLVKPFAERITKQNRGAGLLGYNYHDPGIARFCILKYRIQTHSIDYNRLFGKAFSGESFERYRYAFIKSSHNIKLPKTRALFAELEVMGLEPELRIFYWRDHSVGLFLICDVLEFVNEMTSIRRTNSFATTLFRLLKWECDL